MKFFLGILSLALISRSNAQSDLCNSASLTYTSIVDPYASQYGFFTFAECPGVINPTIGMVVGEVYTFDQTDRSNYYHPMGFAYGKDGALEGEDELEPINTPPGSSSGCASLQTCPAPVYYKDGLMTGIYTNLDDTAIVDGTDFGLEGYEPEFFYPLADWGVADYTIKLRFNVDDITQDIFYFCHIHAGMSGRIKILDAGNTEIVATDTPEIGYGYEPPSTFDANCGTVGLTDYQTGGTNTQCPGEGFVCLAGPTSLVGPTSALGAFADCINAMDCQMLQGMTSSMDETQNLGALFSYQMIPHHINAVNMAKALLFSDALAECTDITEESDACDYERLVREIIVVQNFQIQAMEGVLSNDSYAATNDCTVEILQR